MLSQLKAIKPGLNLKIITTDYELAFIKATQDIFVGVQMRGCFLHYGQNRWRRIQRCRLQARYAGDDDIGLQLRMFYALSFVPEANVVALYDELIKTTFFRDNAEELQELLDYFETT